MQNNPFRRNPGFHPKHKGRSFGNGWENNISNGRFSKKEEDWGAKKFIPVVRTQAATPWATYKNEMIQKLEEERKAAKNPNMNSEEAKQFLKKREENIRRMQIADAMKQDTKWEDFSRDLNEDDIHGSKDKRSNNKSQTKTKKSSIAGNTDKSIPLLDKCLLKNFDSKKLSFHQSNTIRKAITKTTYLARGATLESVVNDLKRGGIKRKKISKK